MTHGLPPGLKEAQGIAEFWRIQHAEEQKRRLDIESSTQKAVTEAAQKANAEGRVEGRREAEKELGIWKDGFMAGRQSVETTNAVKGVSHGSEEVAELMTPLDDQEDMREATHLDGTDLQKELSNEAAELMASFNDRGLYDEGDPTDNHASEIKNETEEQMDAPTAPAELMTAEDLADGVGVNKEDEGLPNVGNYDAYGFPTTTPVRQQYPARASGDFGRWKEYQSLNSPYIVQRSEAKKQKEDLSNIGDQDPYGFPAKTQLHHEDQACASGNGGRGDEYQSPTSPYSVQHSKTVSDVLDNLRAPEASEIQSGRFSGLVSLDPSNNSNDGHHIGNPVNTRPLARPSHSRTAGICAWDGGLIHSIDDTETHARINCGHTHLSSTEPRAWDTDNNPFTRPYHRSSYHGSVGRGLPAWDSTNDNLTHPSHRSGFPSSSLTGEFEQFSTAINGVLNDTSANSRHPRAPPSLTGPASQRAAYHGFLSSTLAAGNGADATASKTVLNDPYANHRLPGFLPRPPPGITPYNTLRGLGNGGNSVLNDPYSNHRVPGFLPRPPPGLYPSLTSPALRHANNNNPSSSESGLLFDASANKLTLRPPPGLMPPSRFSDRDGGAFGGLR